VVIWVQLGSHAQTSVIPRVVAFVVFETVPYSPPAVYGFPVDIPGYSFEIVDTYNPYPNDDVHYAGEKTVVIDA